MNITLSHTTIIVGLAGTGRWEKDHKVITRDKYYTDAHTRTHHSSRLIVKWYKVSAVKTMIPAHGGALTSRACATDSARAPRTRPIGVSPRVARVRRAETLRPEHLWWNGPAPNATNVLRAQFSHLGRGLLFAKPERGKVHARRDLPLETTVVP